MKIDTQYNDIIYNEYENLLAVGVPISRIADLINEKLGTNFAESSLRGRYKQQKALREISIEDDEEYQKRLLTIAKADIKLKHERKLIGKERSVINGIMRETSDNLAVTEAIIQMWNVEPVQYEINERSVSVNGKKYNGYSYGDAHTGYVSLLDKNPYNIDETKKRIKEMFDLIIEDVIRNGYTEIFVSDHGDDIEGSALRISQLTRIAEDMTNQAKTYTTIITNEIMRLSEELPNVKITFIMISSDNHSELRLYGTSRGDLKENLQMLIVNAVDQTIKTAQKYGGMKNIDFIHGDEVLIDFDGRKVVFAHGHQYTKQDNILDQVEHRHDTSVLGYIAGHWHRFSVKYRNIKNKGQQALIHLPSIVGDTDFSDRLFLSSVAGFTKIEIDVTKGNINAKFIPLQDIT